MSAFTSFADQGFADAAEVFGTSSCTINGASVQAIVDQFSATREMEIGGFVGDYDAIAIVRRSALSGVTAPIERTLEGKTFVVDGRTFRIDRVQLDEVSATFGLSNPAKRK